MTGTRIRKPIVTAFLLAALFALPVAAQEGSSDNKLDAGQLGGLKFRSIGPALMSGRIADIAVDPVKPNTWYVAVGSGNVWKTESAGTTWTPIFEHYSSYSTGCITIDPSNRNTIWLGTGENVAGRHAGFGDGVYVSHDAGGSFKNMGLKKSEHLSKIIVHPRNSNIVYVASQGPLWSAGGERGLFKTTDGGKTWNNILSKGEYTGVTDIVMHPSNPNVLYAATYQKTRTVWALLSGGPESGIHKSTDGGKTWSELTNGIPGGNKGKIGLAISPQKPNVVYAAVELPNSEGGFFRSEDNGGSFTKMSDYVGGGTGPHYYQEIWCDPHRFDSIYHANVRLGRSDDGGKTFDYVGNGNKHVDNHAVAFSPLDSDFVIAGCDGGLYKSYDRCRSWSFIHNLPLTQFYKLDVDNDFPFYNVVGGTQDNNTQYGPTATNRAQGIANRDWRIVVGGDGHDCAIDPTDPNIIYGESQQGYLRRYDRRTGETTDIRPQPAAGDQDLRFNWDSPIEISFHDNKRLYFGSRKLHRSDDRGDSWKEISPDLSRNQNRITLPMMGRVWSVDAMYDLYAMSEYNNITSIGESPLDEKLIYVGTDDGLIQVTEDGGENWRKIDLIDGIPKHAFVNDIKADHHDADTVYACLDNHKYGDYKPYVIKSSDRGKTWSLITEGLPDRHLCWRIIQDHEKAGLMFLGTEFGVFATIDGGGNWFKFSNGLPTIPFRDLEIQRRENDLVGATFGRGFYVLDDYSPLREIEPNTFSEKEFHLFKIKDARQFPQADFLGGRRGSQGDSYFVADNPSYGAVFTYFNRDGFESLKSKRKKAEAKIRKAGGDVPMPSLEDLEKENEEVTPKLVFTVTDKSGNTVRRLETSLSKGVNRMAWDLRNNNFAYVAPGEYSVSISRVSDGESTELQSPTVFNVIACIDPSIEGESLKKINAFYERLNQFQRMVSSHRSMMNDAQQTLDNMEQQIANDASDHSELEAGIRNARLAMKALMKKIDNGNSSESAKLGLPSRPTIQSRIGNASGSLYSLSGPTKTHRQSLEIAEDEFSKLQPEVTSFLDSDLKKLRRLYSESGLPWISGQPIK